MDHLQALHSNFNKYFEYSSELCAGRRGGWLVSTKSDKWNINSGQRAINRFIRRDTWKGKFQGKKLGKSLTVTFWETAEALKLLFLFSWLYLCEAGFSAIDGLNSRLDIGIIWSWVSLCVSKLLTLRWILFQSLPNLGNKAITPTPHLLVKMVLLLVLHYIFVFYWNNIKILSNLHFFSPREEKRVAKNEPLLKLSRQAQKFENHWLRVFHQKSKLQLLKRLNSGKTYLIQIIRRCWCVILLLAILV